MGKEKLFEKSFPSPYPYPSKTLRIGVWEDYRFRIICDQEIAALRLFRVWEDYLF